MIRLSSRYSHLLSPIKVRGMVLKNRLWSGNALPHFLQGPESWPSEQVIDHMVRMAKNGAAVVTFADWTWEGQRESFNEDGKRFPMYDINDPSLQNYLCQMADQVHYYNSRISIAIMPMRFREGYDVSNHYIPPQTVTETGEKDFINDDPEVFGELHMMTSAGDCYVKEFTHEMIRELIDREAHRILFYKTMGFDLVTLHFAYNQNLFARFISPIGNTRTDEYGGSPEKRCRFVIELCNRIRELCGKDFPIEMQISGAEVGGNTIEDMCVIAKTLEGYVDIFQIRDGSANNSHPVGYNSVEHDYLTLHYSEALKKSGTTILCNPIGGFQNLDEAEEMIATGKADIMGAARAFICDFDYYKKALEGRGEDVVPCVRCNKCHVPSVTDTWLSFCTVNPEMGIAHKLDFLTDPVEGKKKVAIIGGGPGGMRTALYCAERGHDVTIFEKTDYLGGQLKHADHFKFKWPLRRYRLWLIAQLNKKGVKIVMNTEATPEMLKPQGFDVCVVAIGAVPKMPPIKGIEKAIDHFSVWGRADQLGEKVVVIGGSESGCETAMYLAEEGVDATVLTRSKALAPDTTPIHYRQDFTNYHTKLEKFHAIKQVTTTEVGDGWVKYVDADGAEHTIECDSVIALGGMRPLQEEAMGFYGAADRVLMVGDCYEVGNLREVNRDAYAAAHQF